VEDLEPEMVLDVVDREVETTFSEPLRQLGVHDVAVARRFGEHVTPVHGDHIAAGKQGPAGEGRDPPPVA
jgi:hypothetical protein